jgi:integrase
VARRYSFLHQRGNVYYFFRHDETGKRFEESLRTTDVQVACQKHRQRMDEIRDGRSPNDLGDWTLRKVVEHYLEHRRQRIANGTLKSERSICKKLLSIFGENTRLRSVADIDHVRHYQDVQLETGIAPKTVNNAIQVLATILRLARLWQRVEQDYKPLRHRKSGIPRALTAQESARLLRVAAGSGPYAVAPYAAVLAFDTGMRIHEIKCLRLGDLHHEESNPFIDVRRETTKTDAGARPVALGSMACWALRKLVVRARLLGSVSPEHYLLPTDRSRHTRADDPLNGSDGFDPFNFQTSWEAEWRRFRIAAGIAHHRFHDLRHSFVSRAAEAGVPCSVIQAQVGHLSAEMVRWYTQISDKAQFKAAHQMENHSPELLECLGIRGLESAGQERTASNRLRTRATVLTIQ